MTKGEKNVRCFVILLMLIMFVLPFVLMPTGWKEDTILAIWMSSLVIFLLSTLSFVIISSRS